MVDRRTRHAETHSPAVAWSYAGGMKPYPMRRTARRSTLTGLAVATLALGSLALVGCSPGQRPAEAGAGGLTVELRQNRDQYAVGTAIIRVSNGGATDVALQAVELTGTAFDGATSRDRISTIPSGATKDLVVELPAADCTATDTALQADVSLHLVDGSVLEFDAVPDPSNTLRRVHASSCTASRVAAIATLSTDTPIRLEGSGRDTVAVLTLTVVPTGAAGRLELVELRSTVLLQPAAGGDAAHDSEAWPLGLVVDATSGQQRIEFRLVPTRCDPHALAEDKVGTLFPLVVRIDGGEEETLTLPVTASVTDALKDAVRSTCA